MKIDMHIHTSYSPDGRVEPVEVLKIAKKLGLSAVAITDHNEIKGALKAKNAKIIDVIVGEEVSTSAGHVLAYNIQSLIPRGLSVAETIDKIHECGGIAVIAHPYRFWSGVGEKETLKNIDKVDGIEIFNARSKKRDNEKARALWSKHAEKLFTAGSDAHFPDELGRAGLVYECDDVFECIRNNTAKVFGESRTPRGTARYVKKAVGEWIGRGFKKI